MAKLKQPRRRTYLPEPDHVDVVDVVGTNRYPDVYALLHTERMEGARRDGNTIVFSTEDRVQLRIEIWGDRLWRFRYSLDRPGDDFSYVLADGVEPEETEIGLETTEETIVITTPALQCRVQRADGRLTLTERDGGREVHVQTAPFQARETLLEGQNQMLLEVEAAQGEAFYGLGDKPWDNNLRGKQFENWCEDAFAYGRHSSKLYRAVPFYYGLRDGLGYGIFLNNTRRSHFDFDSYNDSKTRVWTDGGEFDYFFMYGPGLDDVAAAYHRLTGVPELPPLWALGFHQCRWSYYPEERVREVARTFREKKIPCDAIYLDIDYMDGYRCFTWNNEYFPDPAKMIGDLREDGFHTVVMIDPGIRVDDDYAVYTEGMEKDAFCHRSTGEPMVGPVWPSKCVWPDYTAPDVREWWGGLYEGLYNEDGVSGFWNDMNEPAMFKVNRGTFPDDVRHDFDGFGADHREAHNIYGMQMSRASTEGLRQLQPGKRPFLLTRASFSGGQRYAALWTGDNIASWEHLRLAMSQCVRLSISGFSFVGSDIGGFVDDPGGELLTRWLQLAVFHPLMRIHSMGNNTDGAAEAEADEVKQAEKENRQDQEPWAYGEEFTPHTRAAIQWRYRLLPHLYTAFERHLETGVPLLRPLAFADQADPGCWKDEESFLFGDHFLVSPMLKKGGKTKRVYLPAGQWYNYDTGKLLEGGRSVRVKAGLRVMPTFVRAGTVLPEAPLTQCTDELIGVEELILKIYYAERGSGRLFWDAGEGYGYQVDQALRTVYHLDGTTPGSLRLTQEVASGNFTPAVKTYRLLLHGLPFLPNHIAIDGREVNPIFNQDTIEVTVPIEFGEVVIGK